MTKTTAQAQAINVAAIADTHRNVTFALSAGTAAYIAARRLNSFKVSTETTMAEALKAAIKLPERQEAAIKYVDDLHAAGLLTATSGQKLSTSELQATMTRLSVMMYQWAHNVSGEAGIAKGNLPTSTAPKEWLVALSEGAPAAPVKKATAKKTAPKKEAKKAADPLAGALGLSF